MYHRVWPGMADSLTITPEKLEEQWNWLKAQGYSTLSLQQYLDIATGRQTTYPGKSLLITFDDGYLNNLTYAYPLLQKLGWQATFFIIGGTLDGSYPKSEGVDEKMSIDDLKTLDPATVQLAMHGYQHKDIRSLDAFELVQEFANMCDVFEDCGIPYVRTFAYPYGSRPKNKKHFDEIRFLMNELAIESAFRIGNQVSKVPAPDIHEIKRIDICGTDTLEEFKIKLRKGKLKPF